MNSYILIRDFKRLFKKNKKEIYGLTILISILIFGLLFLSSRREISSNQEDISNEEIEDVNEENYPPAIFRLYVEHEDGTIYINSMLIEEYFITPEVVLEAEQATNVDITNKLERERESSFEKTQDDRGVLGVSRNTSNHIFTFATSVGTVEENLLVAEFYYNYLNELEVLENKLVYIVSEPEIFDVEKHADTGIQITETTAENNLIIESIKMFITIILCLTIGLLLSILYFIVKSFFAKTINYSFNYKVSDLDEVYLIDSENSVLLNRYINSIGYPIIILTEDNISNKLNDLKNYINNQESNQVIVSSTVDSIDPKIPIKNPIVIIDTFKTSKTWYREIHKTFTNYNTSITIFQVN